MALGSISQYWSSSYTEMYTTKTYAQGLQTFFTRGINIVRNFEKPNFGPMIVVNNLTLNKTISWADIHLKFLIDPLPHSSSQRA